MRNAVIPDLLDYVKKHYRLILLSIAAAVLCFGFLVFCGNIRIDTEELLNEPGSTLGWLTIGRYSLVLFKRLLGLTTHDAIKSGVLFFVFFLAGANLLMFSIYHLSGKKERYPYWIFLTLYTTSNIWSFQVYFSLQQAEVALAMLLLAAAALLSVRAAFVMPELMMPGFAELEPSGRGTTDATRTGTVVRFLVSTLFLVLGLGAYQALASYYIAICIVLFLALLSNRDYFPEEGMPQEERWQNRRLWIGIVELAVQFGVAFVIYKGIADTWFMAAGSYMEDQMGWGRLSVTECIKNVLRTGKNILIGYGPRNFSFFTVGTILIAALVFFIWRQKRYRSGMRFLLFLLGVAGILASPFLMTLYMGEMLVTRAQFALPVAAAFLGMYGIGLLRKGWENRKGVTHLCTTLVLLTVALQTGYNLQMAYTDQVRYEQDRQLSDKIIAALTAANDGELPEIPVLFVGYQKSGLDAWCFRTEMYGWSFYEWDYDATNPTGATHRIVGFLEAYRGIELSEDVTEEQREAAVALSETMTVFPEEGSILVTDEFVVVKLSEIVERTDNTWW